MNASFLLKSGMVCAWILMTVGTSWGVVQYRHQISSGVDRTGKDLQETGFGYVTAIKEQAGSMIDDSYGRLLWLEHRLSSAIEAADFALADKIVSVTDYAGDVTESLASIVVSRPDEEPLQSFVTPAPDLGNAPPSLTLTEMREIKNDAIEAESLARIEPSSAEDRKRSHWQVDEETLSVEAVLVPRQVTVISSSQDGRIASIPVDHGDVFRRGDLLVSYDCAGLEAETDIIRMEKNLTGKKVIDGQSLFKLDIISDVDRMGMEIEDKKATAKKKLIEKRLEDCYIRAMFDGRVTNKLANPGEYTRTDRVLLEVASVEPLQAEFLIPSKWLRWINIGSPLTIQIGETDKEYNARVKRIYGEVDPVSQSIQIVADLDPYDEPLLPGMSGQALLDLKDFRESGVSGFLDQPDKQN